MEFEIMINKINGIVFDERKIRNSLNSINNELQTCQYNIGNCLHSSASSSINKSIKNIREKLEGTSNKIGMMGDKLATIATMYSQTESAILEYNFETETINKNDIDNGASPSNDFVLKLLKLMKVNDSAEKNIKHITSLLSKYMQKNADKSKLIILGPSVAYCNDLWKILHMSGNERKVNGKVIVDLTKDGADVWKSLYQYLDRNLVEKMNKNSKNNDEIKTVLGNEFGNTVGYVSLISSTAGFCKDYFEAMDTDYTSSYEIAGESVKLAKSGVEVVESSYNLYGMSKGMASESASKASAYFTLAETALSTGGQALTSYGKYNADGKITVTEASEIAIESSVSGLTTLVSGVTGGIIDIDSDATSAMLEDWGRDEGTSIANAISKNPKMKEKFQNGNAIEQAEAFGWGIVKNQLDKKVQKVENIYNFSKDLGESVIKKIKSE